MLRAMKYVIEFLIKKKIKFNIYYYNLYYIKE